MRALVGEYGMVVLGVTVTFILLELVGELLGSDMLFELVRIKADCLFL